MKSIRQKILSLKLVFIQLDNEEDAYLIFEILNARGRDLTTSDLVKNLLLKKLKSGNTQLDAAKETWNRIVKKFDDAGIRGGLDPFLYHFWLSRYEYTTEKNLFGKIKTLIDDSKLDERLSKNLKENADYYLSAEDLLNSLQQNGDYYLTIVSPDTCDWTLEEQPVKQSLKSLSLFNVKQQHPMSLALMRAYKMKKITLRQLRKTLEKIEFFHYAFNSITSQRSSGSISTHYSKYAIALSKAKNSDEVQIAINEMLEGLKRKKPSFNEFKAAFEDLTYTSKNTKSKNLIKYTLQKILGVSARGVAIDYSSMTIEHILPESTEGQDDLGQYIGSIGNLILVDQKTNGEELGSLAFHQKKMILQQKGYPLDEYISQQDIWEKEQIRARTEQLARIVFEEIVNL